MTVGIMTAEKPQQEAVADGNGPPAYDAQPPRLPQDTMAAERGTKPTENPSLPADLIQVEEQAAYVQTP